MSSSPWLWKKMGGREEGREGGMGIEGERKGEGGGGGEEEREKKGKEKEKGRERGKRGGEGEKSLMQGKGIPVHELH